MRILIGFLIDGKSSGIDKYLQLVMDIMQDSDLEMDFLTTKINRDLQEFLQKRKVHLFEVSSLKKPVQQYKQIKKIILEQKYDAVYINISESFNCMGVLAAHSCGVNKIIVHSHSSGAGGASSVIRAARSLLNLCFKPVLAHMCTDFYACSQVAGAWLYPKRILSSFSYKVINNAVQVSKFSFNKLVRARVRAELGIEDAVVIGHVGSYSYAKNNLFLLDVLTEVLKIMPNAILLAVGEGPDWKMVKEEANRKGLGHNIMFLGIRTDVAELLQAMDIFILPSRFEGQPIAAIEAQISGLKVILSDTITKEAQISDYCLWASIRNGAAEWAKIIVDNLDYTRLIIKAGDPLVQKYDYDFQKMQIKRIFHSSQDKEKIYE